MSTNNMVELSAVELMIIQDALSTLRAGLGTSLELKEIYIDLQEKVRTTLDEVHSIKDSYVDDLVTYYGGQFGKTVEVEDLVVTPYSPPEVDDEDIDDEDIDDDDSLELPPVGTWPAYCEPCGKVQAFTRDPASVAMEDWECPTCKGGINL